MLLDFREQDGGSTILTDVCVIGSGAAGITLAVELDGSGLDVVLLAGGGANFEAETQDLYRSRLAGLLHKGIHDSRARVHGGTTTLWAGQALPLDPIDFEHRDWVPYSGWPFDLESLEPYYRRAERIMKLPAISYDEDAWPPGLLKPPKFDPDVFYSRISHFAHVPNFATSYSDELRRSANVKVLLNAHAVGLETNTEETRLDRIALRSLCGRSATIESRFVVVCCGAIETARLLLASDKVNPRGVGNANDLVGRFFQDHLQSVAAPIRTTHERMLRKVYGTFSYNKTRYAPRFCASKALQRQKKILNICGGITYRQPTDSAVDSAKLLVRALRRKELRPQIPRALGNLIRRPHEAAAASLEYLLYRRPMVTRRGPIHLGIQSEQAPNPDSRVSLDEDRDALGMKRTLLDWRLTELDRRTLHEFVQATDKEFQRLGLGTVEASEFSRADDLSKIDDKIYDCAHHIGTTRMHDDPKQGVVDRHCRVHGVENLYIGSSSVFPTGGSSNPTLTIIALCLKIADRIRRESASGGVAASTSSPNSEANAS